MRKLGPSSTTCTKCGGRISVNPPRPHTCKEPTTTIVKKKSDDAPPLGGWLIEKKTQNQCWVSMVDLMLRKATIGGLPYTFREVKEHFESPINVIMHAFGPARTVRPKKIKAKKPRKP